MIPAAKVSKIGRSEEIKVLRVYHALQESSYSLFMRIDFRFPWNRLEYREGVEILRII